VLAFCEVGPGSPSQRDNVLVLRGGDEVSLESLGQARANVFGRHRAAITPCKCGRLRCICVQVFEVASVARPPRKRETEA
jgi:hypothetical protein